MAQAFTPSWRRDDPAATALLRRSFDDPAARAEVAQAAAARAIRPEIHAAIAAQEGRRPQSPSRTASLAALGRPGTVAIVTGQQVGLFLGPLYTLHKAVACVVNARALAAETGREVVPIFWLQTEDADFEEVRSVGLPGAEGVPDVVSVGDGLGPEGARVSLAHRRLGPSILAALDDLAAPLAATRAGDEVLAILARHYHPEATVADAFAGVLAELFADHGLLIVDPRAPELAPHSAAHHRAALERADDLSDRLMARAAAIDAAGFNVQVPVRGGACLSCFHPDGPTGERFRLVPNGDGRWRLAGDERLFETPALLDALAEDARHFSTTALSRPLLQDEWLPTVGYVGGPGELAYWAQLPPIYEALGVAMPLAVPRARFTIIGPTDTRLAAQLGLTAADAARPRQDLLTELGARAGAQRAFDVEGAKDAALAGVTSLFSELLQHGTDCDKGLPKAARKAESAVDDIIGRVVSRYQRAVAQADEAAVGRLDRFIGLLAPGGAPQERVYGWPFFAGQHGPDALLSALFEAATPFCGDLREVRP